MLFKFLKSLGLHEEEKNKKVATAAAATAMDPELLDLFEGDAKYGLNTFIGIPSVADPESGAFWTPGSGMGKKSGSGSGMNNPNHIFESLETIFLG